MGMKEYRSQTTVGVSVSMRDGRSTRVSFSPLMDGGSVYYTRDPELQWGLEHHRRFGELFILYSEKSEESETDKKRGMKRKKAERQVGEEQHNEREETGKADGETDEEAQGVDEEIREISVTDMDDAKDYLSEHHGIVRTKLKSRESIEKAAKELGIRFKVL